MDKPTFIPEGNAKRIEVETSKETKKEFKKVIAQIDPDLTYEQILQLLIHTYYEDPELFKNVHEYGSTF